MLVKGATGSARIHRRGIQSMISLYICVVTSRWQTNYAAFKCAGDLKVAAYTCIFSIRWDSYIRLMGVKNRVYIRLLTYYKLS